MYAIYGLSMGGAIAYTLAIDGRLKIKFLMLDGAPLVRSSKFLEWMMRCQYLKLLHSLKERSSRVLDKFEKIFLPRSYLDWFLSFADIMSESSVKNMIGSVSEMHISKVRKLNVDGLMYLHGTMINEVISVKSSRAILKLYPQTKILKFKGYAHAELAIYHPQEWLSVFHEFVEL